MRKKYWAAFAVILVGLFSIAATTVVSTYFKGGLKVGPGRDGLQPYMFQAENPSGNTVFSVDNFGRINQEDIVVINNVNQLTSFSGDTAGTSIYRMLWGKRYIVDPYAISASGAGMITGGLTGIQTFTGVSMILPFATSGNSNYRQTSVEMRSTGATGYALLVGGATPVWVWAPVNPGSTRYAVTGGIGLSGGSYHTVFVRVPAGNTGYYTRSTDILTSATSGGSIWGINKPNESITFEYVQGSGVSVAIKSANLYDVAGE